MEEKRDKLRCRQCSQEVAQCPGHDRPGTHYQDGAGVDLREFFDTVGALMDLGKEEEALKLMEEMADSLMLFVK